MSTNEDNATTALNAIITALTPLKSEERQRIVGAAMLFLGEKAVELEQKGKPEDNGGDGGVYSANARKWMKQNNVTAEELEHVFLIKEDKTFDIHDVPGTSKKVRTLNTYILTGLGRFLAADEKTFADTTARQICEDIGCYDSANHSAYIGKKGSNFSGDKSKGWTITPGGLKTGAALVKELAAAAK